MSGLWAAGVTNERVLRCVCKTGTAWGDGISEKVVWQVVKHYARKLGIARLAPHDLRRSCARLCRLAGGEQEQIQFLLGHVSVQTTEIPRMKTTDSRGRERPHRH